MIDSHCHINDELYRENPIEYIKDAGNMGVFQFLVVGFDRKIKPSATVDEIKEMLVNAAEHATELLHVKK